MTEIDTVASKDADSFCCDAINLTIVALSCEPDLPRASDDHHESRRWRNMTCNSRATAPSTPPSKTSVVAAAELPPWVACRCKKPLPSCVDAAWATTCCGMHLHTNGFGSHSREAKKSLYGSGPFELETKRHPILASS